MQSVIKSETHSPLSLVPYHITIILSCPSVTNVIVQTSGILLVHLQFLSKFVLLNIFILFCCCKMYIMKSVVSLFLFFNFFFTVWRAVFIRLFVCLDNKGYSKWLKCNQIRFIQSLIGSPGTVVSTQVPIHPSKVQPQVGLDINLHESSWL